MKILLCPRCHAQPELKREQDEDSGFLVYWVECSCGAIGDECVGIFADESAIDSWNDGYIRPTLPIVINTNE